MSTQTEGLQLMFEALLRAEWPLVAERTQVAVGYTQREFTVEQHGARVLLTFGRQAFGSPRLMDIIHEAGAACEQLLTAAPQKPRQPSSIVELHHKGAPLTNGNQQLTKVMISKSRTVMRCAREWLMDSEGIECSIRVEEGGKLVMRVHRDVAQCARASLRLFHEEWRQLR